MIRVLASSGQLITAVVLKDGAECWPYGVCNAEFVYLSTDVLAVEVAIGAFPLSLGVDFEALNGFCGQSNAKWDSAEQ